MYEPQRILRLLEDRMVELGVSQAELGMRAFGKLDNSAIQSLKRGSSPSIDRVEAMAKALDLELYFGPRGGRPRGFSEDPAALAQAGSAYLPIPWLDPIGMPGMAPVMFNQDWMQDHGLVPDALVSVIPDIVSIEGWHEGQTLAVVDTSAAQRQTSGFWCMKEGGQTSLAMTHFEHGVIVIMPSDHRASPRILVGSELKESVRMIGKVVWSGQLWY